MRPSGGCALLLARPERELLEILRVPNTRRMGPRDGGSACPLDRQLARLTKSGSGPNNF